MRNKKKFATSLLCGMSSFMLAAVPVMANAEVQKYTNTDFAMDTVVSETLYTTGEDLNTTMGDKLREIETGLLSWTDENSQIAKLNAASGEAIEVDELLKDVGYGKVSLDGDKVTLEKGATLDLGATGKGIGCDVVSDFLKTQTDVSGMILNLGGSSVMAYGEKPDGSDWKVALTDPRDPEGDYLGAITLNDGEFLSTSGDYEKYFIEDGKRYHHILDPKTGYPVWNGLDSVTVICDSGLFADGLSTACFVLGMDDALKLLEKYNADAVFVDEDKNIYLTSGMKERFELMKNTYTVKELQ